MQFSDSSDITLVITSCGRFDLLKRTLESLDKYIEYPIMKVIITEDSGSSDVHLTIPEQWKLHTDVIINDVKLGQLASIDKAYELVKTSYIFHCEDDWEFYRTNFISDSLKILTTYPEVDVVRLRSYYYDIAPHYPFHFLGEREVVGSIPFYKLDSTDPLWRGFSFNPGLRRLADYKKVAPYARFESSSKGESGISIEFHNLNMRTVLLENDACAHIGYGNHVITDSERLVQAKKKKVHQFRYVGLFILGIIIGSWM